VTPERSKLLGELLTELAEDPEGFIPDEAWYPAQEAFSLSYVEMACVRRGNTGRAEVLLAYRDDKHFKGWHIPGALWRTRQTLEECLGSLSRRELGQSVRITLLAKGGWEKWHDHPYGYPISHIVICSAEGVVESGTLRWFDAVPEGMEDDGGHHERFFRDVLQQAETLV
jgi:ADP-ribose pyrophosphatase YjhB (NUDIX family)